MKRAVVFSPVWGLCCIFLVLASSCRHSDISEDGLSDAVYLSAEVLQGPLGKGAPVTGANLTQWSVFGYPQGDRLWSDQLEGAVLPSLFYDVPVDKQSDGSWSYGTPVAWGGLAYNYYAFFGYAPKATGMYRDPENPTGNNLELVGTSSTAGVAQLNYETLADVTSQIDLLAGVRTNLLASKKVTMQLGHMLSQIRFTAWSAQAGVTPISIAVNGIQYKSVLSSKGGKAAWLSTDPAMRGFDLRGNYPVLSVKEDQPTDLSADGRSFMLLPQDLTANTTATIDIIALVGGVEVVSTPYVINENWEAGKSYTYVLKLGGSPTEELIVTDVLVTDWVVDSEEDMSTTPVGYDVNPPKEDQYVEIDGVRWTTGNLVAKNKYQCVVGAPTDGGLYFQFGSLIGWKGGDLANGGKGVGSNPYTGSNTEWWGGATSWNWSNDAKVWPAAMASTPTAWSPNAAQATEANAFQKWYFDFSGTSQNGSINYSTAQSDIRSYTHPTLGALKEGKMASLGIGDPCTYYLGAPWRTPTAAEYLTLLGASGANTNKALPLKVNNYDLFFPASGTRLYSSGSFYNVTTRGYYWSSSVSSATSGYNLSFNQPNGVIPQLLNYRSYGFPVRCVSGTYVPPPSNPVNPPTASDYVEIDGLKWTKGNLVASSSTASGSNGCKVGTPTDGGLYFQFGSLIGWKGGATANNGTGVGANPNTASATQWWGGAGSWSWSNDAMVWPTAMTSTPTAWSPDAAQATEANAFQKWYFDFSGTSQNGSINYSTAQSDIRSYTHPTLGALKEGKMASLGIGDPCTYYLGAPWRTPTAAEYLTLLGASGANTNKALPLKVNNYDLFFPASGLRLYSNGSFYNVTTDGYGWSSSVYDATYGLYLDFNSSWVYPQNYIFRSYGFPVRCVSGTYVPPSNPVNPPTASDYVEIDGLKWAKGNLVASSSTAGNMNGCKVGAPTDGGLYFQFGSLIGWKGGATANNGTGVGSNPNTGSNTEWWGGAGSWSWSNDAMVWPTAMTSTPTAWSPNAAQATEANAFKKWYFDFSGTSQNGSINYSTAKSDIRSYTHPTLGALKEGKMASLGIGDPCTYYLGAPWRTPTAAEYLTLLGADGAKTNKAVPLKVNNYDLFFPASGHRHYSGGSFYGVTTRGDGWSSSVNDATGGLTLGFDSSWVYPQDYGSRSYGFPVRCVAK